MRSRLGRAFGFSVIVALIGCLPVSSARAQCPCPGDMNGNAVVNQGDVSQFVTALLNNTFDACADVSLDGLDNGRDVKPFVVRVIAGTTCTGACCVTSGTCIATSQPSCTQQSGVYQGNGTLCSPNPCPQTGACCINGNCIAPLSGPNCTGQGGVFQGIGTLCTPNPCPPVGACCINGNCTVLTGAACAGQSGTFQGVGTVCTPNPCPQTGACCVAGNCIPTSQPACSDQNGTFQLGVPCTPNPCPPSGACCLNSTCTQSTQASCLANGGSFFVGSSCTVGFCSQSIGACCLNTSVCVEHLSAVECAGSGGVFRGAGTGCPFVSCAGLTGACCMPDGTCAANQAQENCEAIGGNYQGDSVVCTATLCVIGACCFDDLGVCLEDLQPTACAEFGGAYLGDGSACLGHPCPLPTGACCISGTSCIPQLIPSDCATLSGTYLGDGSTCAPPNCQPPTATGACCANFTCTAGVTEANCATLGGTYLGDDSICSPNPCPAATGACCIEGLCTDDVESTDCADSGGTYLGNGQTCPNPGCVPLETGACCLPDGVCADVDLPDCQDAGGLFSGEGSICAEVICPPPIMGEPAFLDMTTLALDPKLVNSPGASIVYRIENAGNWQITLEILDGATVVKTLLNNVNRAGLQDFTEIWDGKLADNVTFASPKKYELRIQVNGGATKLRDIWVVRVGVSQIRFTDSSDSASVEMQFHRKTSTNLANVPYDIQWMLSSLDSGNAARPDPPPHSDFSFHGDGDLQTNANNYSYPIAYTRGKKLKMQATTASGAQGFDIPVGAPDVRLKSGFSAATTHDAIASSTTCLIESDAGILSANVAKTTLNHQFEYFYKHAAGDFRSLGKQNSRHITYTTFAPSMMPAGGQPGNYPYPDRFHVFIMDVTTVAAAGQIIRKNATDTVFNPGMVNTGMQYGDITKPGGGGAIGRDIDSALDYKKAMCGTMASFFRMMCGAQGIAISANFYNLKNDADRPFANQAPAGDDVRVAGSHIHTGPNGICNTAAAAPNTQLIPVNQGLPGQRCIGPGANLVLNTVAAGDDMAVGQSIYTGADGICQTPKAGDDTQVIPVGQGAPNTICAAPGGYQQSAGGANNPTYSYFTEAKWWAIVIKAAGLNRAVNPMGLVDWPDVDANYNGNPDSIAMTDVTTRNERRYAFWANDDGHVINFLEEGNDVWLYDASFLTGPVQNPYGALAGVGIVPTGHKRGSDNATFRTTYYNAAIDYHLGTINFNSGATNIRTLTSFTIKTTLLPNIADYELHLHWEATP